MLEKALKGAIVFAHRFQPIDHQFQKRDLPYRELCNHYRGFTN